MAFSKVAIVGATGLVGLELVSILENRRYPVEELRLFASGKSEGMEVRFGGKHVRVEPVEKIDLSGMEIAFYMAGADISRKFVPAAENEGVIAIDNSSAFRRESHVPLIVPEVNPHAVTGHSGLISNPNCTVIQLVVAIHPIHLLSPIRRLVVSTYQSISGAGRGPREDLISETRTFLEGEPSETAFNLWPGIDRILADGYYYEEEKVLEETRKILECDRIEVAATTVRVPVLRAHSISVYLETEDPVDLPEIRRALRKAPGVEFVDNDGDLQRLSPVNVAGEDGVRVGRLRKDRWSPGGLLLWVVADNLRKGAALNAVQIAEILDV
jgi:aspartate-semialdehyde dehydrogenase